MLKYKDELTCDMAEYYGVLNMEELPASKLATLSCGLPENSRTMMRVNGQKLPMETMLLAAIADRLSLLVWLNSKDGQKGRNRPESILSELTEEKTENNLTLYKDGEAFEAARKNIMKGVVE